MSKFEDLCVAFGNGRDEAIADRDAAFDFQARLVSGFKSYLDYPTPFQFQPVISKPKPDSVYTPQGAVELGDDGFWHFGLVLTIYAAKNQFPQFRGLIHFSFRRSGDSFVVKPRPNGSEITIKGTTPTDGDLKPVYDALFEMIRGYFSSIAAPSGEEDIEKKIGFV